MSPVYTKGDRSESATQLLVNQNQILGMIASGEKTDVVLNGICRKLEAMLTEAACSVMLFDNERRLLKVASAPSACGQLIDAIDGTPPGIGYGSCAAAAFTGEPAIVTDTATDPRWELIRGAAEQFNIHACWSIPIRIDEKLPIGTFAISHSRTRTPTRFDLELLETGAYLVGMLVRRDQTQAQLREQSRMVLEAQDSERSELARELHDGIGQVLFGLQLSLKAKTGSLDVNFDRELTILNDAFTSVRDVSHLLAPPELETMSLTEAIHEYVCTDDDAPAPQVTLKSEGVEPDLRFEARSHLFRTVQEAVTNARKHAKASRVMIAFDWTGKNFVLRISDDGSGLPADYRKGIGMRSIRLRAENLNGTVQWLSCPSTTGTILELVFPAEVDERESSH